MKAAQNPSIVSYRTHRITDLDVGVEGGPWDFMERIEVTSQADYEKQAATGSKEFLDLLYTQVSRPLEDGRDLVRADRALNLGTGEQPWQS